MVIIAMVLSAAVSLWGLLSMKQLSTENSRKLGETAAQDAERALEDLAVQNLQTTTEERAAYIEEKFSEVASYVHGIAAQARLIYENPDQYPDREVPFPVKGSTLLAPQLLWSESLVSEVESTSPSDSVPHLSEEILKLGNLQDMLVQYNANNDMVSSTYIATKSGWLIQADYIADSKYSGDSDLPDYYEASQRQWYQRAAGAGEGQIVYSDVIRDIYEGGNCIVCAEPVYLGGELVAVAGVGSYLDTVNEAVLNTTVGVTGYAFLIGQQGQVMVSPKREGDTAVATEEIVDIRQGSNTELADLAADVLFGGSGVEKITLDGREVYLAYTPMNSLGWGLVAVMDVEEVIAPAEVSQNRILSLAEDVSENQSETIRGMLVFFLAVMTAVLLFICLSGTAFSGKLTDPIRILTKEVAQTDGGNLDFNIRLETGDEVEDLGNAFNKMTAQLKEYIGNLAAATAEKERIRTELSLASAIQADMLPDSGHALREWEEISLYASMTPAKEVGGDFYDFFRTDQDHLVFLIADVSGKGVPASLFMVVAKTLLQSRIAGSDTLAEAVAAVNERLCAGNKNGMFVTAWIGVLELSTGLLTYVNAGHNPPLLGSREKGFDFLKERSGFVLAGMEGMVYKQMEMQLSPGDILFLYTDGVTEANDRNGNLYGEPRLSGVLGSRTEASPKQLAEAVWEDIQVFKGEAEQFDDITMLVLGYLGKGDSRAAGESVMENQNRNTGSANLSRLASVQTFVGEMFAEGKVPTKDIHRFLIASDEVFSNVCRYGGAGEVMVECSVEEDGAHLIFEDDGTAFNPLEKPDPDTGETLESRKAGGLGIFMVRKLMDEVSYERTGGKNRLTMTIRDKAAVK